MQQESNWTKEFQSLCFRKKQLEDSISKAQQEQKRLVTEQEILSEIACHFPFELISEMISREKCNCKNE